MQYPESAMKGGEIVRQIQNGGRPTFARYTANSAIDLKTLRQDVERAQAKARDANLPLADRRRWLRYSDLVESALDIRIELLQRSAVSHESAISGNRTTLCGSYECNDPSCRELLCLAEIRRRTEQSVPA